MCKSNTVFERATAKPLDRKKVALNKTNKSLIT